MSDQKKRENELEQLLRLWEEETDEANGLIVRVPFEEHPREKLLAKGPGALSDLELMAILLGSGTKSSDVFALADRMLTVFNANKTHPDVTELLKIEGVGPARAAAVAAAVEFVRRRIHPRGYKISRTTDVLPFISYAGTSKQEHFFCISLNAANEVLGIRTVAIGLVDRVHIHPREVFADPITDRATGVIVAHNHPSGDVTPTGEDRLITRYLKGAGKFLGIQLLDHIIFSLTGHCSALESGEL